MRRLLHNRIAFTLVELVVVIAIIGLMTATASIAIRQPLKLAELELFIEQFKAMDSVGRERARKGTALVLDIRLEDRSISLQSVRNGHIQQQILIPPSVKLSAFHGLSSNSQSGSGGQLRFTRFGTSPTYGFAITAGEANVRYLIIFGLTGQCEVLESLAELNSLLRV
ncbi:MAG: prepilin-type N-terminal cleavage/methylation domain-containing protein [Planctomycetota bacterium]